MHARRSLDEDEDYHSLDRDEDYQDDDAYDEMMKELKDEDRNYGDDDSQEEEELQDEDDTIGTVIIYKYFQTTHVSEISNFYH